MRWAEEMARKFLASFLLLLLFLSASSCTKGKEKKDSDKLQRELKNERNQKTGEFEIWRKQKKIVLPDITSTSSLVLPNGSIRCYLSKEGYIHYAESKDGENFGEMVKTTVGSESQESMPFNPCILRLRSGRFMLLYNTGQTRLHLAYSEDGKSFQDRGVVADSEKDQYAVVQSVDTVLLPDGRIRLYGSEKGISTAVSKDGGRTWVTDGFGLIGDRASDPDVHLREDGTYIMYYLFAARVAGVVQKKAMDMKDHIKMAVSKDGLNWKLSDKNIVPPDITAKIVSDPDYIRQQDKTEIMFFSQSKTTKDKDEGKANLQIAVRDK